MFYEYQLLARAGKSFNACVMQYGSTSVSALARFLHTSKADVRMRCIKFFFFFFAQNHCILIRLHEYSANESNSTKLILLYGMMSAKRKEKKVRVVVERACDACNLNF